MVLLDEHIYENKETGLAEAPKYLRELYRKDDLRVILESVLIDPSPPQELISSLFGITGEDTEVYKYFFFNIPVNTSRMDIYEYIECLPSVTELQDLRRTLFTEVFYNGWEFIDAKYNRNCATSVRNYGEHIFKKMLSYLKDKSDKLIQEDDLKTLKTVMQMLKDGTKLYDENDGEGATDKITLSFVKEIEKKAGRQPKSHVKVDGMEMDEKGVSIQSEVNEKTHKKIARDVSPSKKKNK